MKQYTLSQVTEVALAFKNHEIIAIPTDTVYGVGVKYGDINDLDALKHAKNRPETKPIPMMVCSVEQMEEVAFVNENVKKIAQAFLPGALTLVLKKKECVDDIYTNGMDTIAIRIPDVDFILSLIKEIGSPILVSSANQSGQKTAVTYEDVFEQLPNIDGIVIGKCDAGQASTIIDCTKENVVVLRPGPISLEQIQSVL
ncbi:MAG: L-threonylcarbamoyladenylate synthase [Bacillota bacterium]|nr:L-threonylcarbamoyladenylate synthase [Bacillota bacterium]